MLKDLRNKPLAERGMAIRDRINDRVLDTLTAWGMSAARRFHEYPGPVAVEAGNEKGGD